jgi:hypothetical protein
VTGAALVRQEFVECVVWSAAAAGVLVLNRSAWKVGAGSTTPRRADARQPRLDTRSRVRSAATAMSPVRDAGGRDDRSGERVSAA